MTSVQQLRSRLPDVATLVALVILLRMEVVAPAWVTRRVALPDSATDVLFILTLFVLAEVLRRLWEAIGIRR